MRAGTLVVGPVFYIGSGTQIPTSGGRRRTEGDMALPDETALRLPRNSLRWKP